MEREVRCEPSKRFVFMLLANLVAAGVSAIALAQTNVLPIGPKEIEVQVRQQWEDSKATCERPAQTKIDHVDIITSNEFKRWLVMQHVVTDDGIKVMPEGNYIRVATSAEGLRDGISAYGPIHNALQSADFGNIIGLTICNYRLFRK